MWRYRNTAVRRWPDHDTPYPVDVCYKVLRSRHYLNNSIATSAGMIWSVALNSTCGSSFFFLLAFNPPNLLWAESVVGPPVFLFCDSIVFLFACLCRSCLGWSSSRGVILRVLSWRGPSLGKFCWSISQVQWCLYHVCSLFFCGRWLYFSANFSSSRGWPMFVCLLLLLELSSMRMLAVPNYSTTALYPPHSPVSFVWC